MDAIGTIDSPPSAAGLKAECRVPRKPRKVRERIETARIARLVRLVGGDMGKMVESGELADYPALAQEMRGTLAVGVERLFNTMQDQPRGLAGHNVTLEVVASANAVLKSAITAINGAGQSAGGTTININLPSGDEARAILGRLAGVKRSRIVDIENEKD